MPRPTKSSFLEAWKMVLVSRDSYLVRGRTKAIQLEIVARVLFRAVNPSRDDFIEAITSGECKPLATAATGRRATSITVLPVMEEPQATDGVIKDGLEGGTACYHDGNARLKSAVEEEIDLRVCHVCGGIHAHQEV